MTLLQKFQSFIKQENLFQQNDRLLLAVSGGVDSVVLCDLCKHAGYDFFIAHCNFQLRGEESERDEVFVRSLGEKYGVEVVVERFDTAQYANERKMSIQEAARELRYGWFLSLSAKIMLPDFDKPHTIPGWHITIDDRRQKLFTVTAHHANDSVETLLMNFFKGTGIKGLQGIKPKQDSLAFVIRPLLFARKEELLLYAKTNNLPFVEDSSNASDKYTRNYFRNQLIPDLKKVYPQVEDNLMDNLLRFREIEILYQQSVTLHKKKLLEQRGNEVHIPVLKLLKTEPLGTVLFEIIREFGFTSHQTEEALALLKSETGKYIRSHSHRIIRNRNWLIISPVQTEMGQHILIEEADKNISFEGGSLHIDRQSTFTIQQSALVAQLDVASIQFPLLLRKWKQGDYFYPLGMTKKKKLSRFFTDQKLSLTQKENTWVIEMDKKIIWVVGLRIDNRFKISPATKDIFCISFKPTAL